MLKIILFIFALPELLKCRVNPIEFTFKTRIGVVSLNSFCSAFGGFGELEGATLSLFNSCKLFTNAKTSKQFTAGAQGVYCRNGMFTKRTKSITYHSTTFQRVQQYLVLNSFRMQTLCYSLQNVPKRLSFWERKNPARSLSNVVNPIANFLFTKRLINII